MAKHDKYYHNYLEKKGKQDSYNKAFFIVTHDTTLVFLQYLLSLKKNNKQNFQQL